MAIDEAAITALSQALADRLDAVVPRPLRVEHRDGVIGVINQDRGDWSGGQGVWRLDGLGATRDERMGSLAWYCEQVLSGIQDQVVLEVRTPWPRASDPTGVVKLPLPFAKAEGEIVRLGFCVRGQNRPVLELEALKPATLGLL